MDPSSTPAGTDSALTAPTEQVTPAAPQEPTPAQAPSPQQTGREAIYAKYNSLYSNTPEADVSPTEPGTPVAPESAVVPEAAAPPSEAATLTPSVPSPQAPQQPDFSPVMAKMLAQLEALEKRTAPPPPPAPEPIDINKVFAEKLQTGDVNDAVSFLTSQIEERLKKAQPAPVDAQAIKTQLALEMRLENDLTKFIDTLRASAPDVVPMEPYIVPLVAAEMTRLQSEGKITSPQAYADAYKRVCEEKFTDARKLVQQFRAAGKQEANTTSTEVLRASTLPPTPPSADRGIAPPQTGVPDISASTYLQRRQTASLRSKGL